VAELADDALVTSRLNNLTLGLDRYARRNSHRLPVAIMRLRAVRRRTAQFFGAYDAVLTPTVADETARLPRPDRRLTADHRPNGQLGRLSRRCERHRRARYPTGAGRIRERYASRHDALCRRRMRSAAAGIGLRTRRGPALDPHPVSRSGLMRAVTCALLVELPGTEPAVKGSGRVVAHSICPAGRRSQL
jgi:hypothetical protein